MTERAVGSDVLEALSPAQTIIKIVNEELTALIGRHQHQAGDLLQAPPRW